MMRFPWVSRALLEASAESRDSALRSEGQLWRRIDVQNSALADWQKRYDVLQSKYDALVAQVIDFKRHEVGMSPTAFDASLLDPMNSLGPKTQLAVDEFAAGDPEMKKYLVGRAHLESSALRGQSDDMDAIDTAVAQKVRQGDR